MRHEQPAIFQNVAAKLVEVPGQESRMCERHYSPAQLAEQWSLSEDTVRRIFEREPGVLIFENAERISSRRRLSTRQFDKRV